MAPLAAKWGRLWRALLGQARIGHEARGLPTSPCSPTGPPSAGESPALLPLGLSQELSPRTGAGLGRECRLHLCTEPCQGGKQGGRGPAHCQQLSLLKVGRGGR